MSDVRITVADARRAGFCAMGIRSWSEAKGLPFRDFLANGLDPAEERFANDGHVQRVLAMKKKAPR